MVFKTHEFTTAGGEKIIEGKSRHPDMIRINLDRRQSWQVAHDLLHFLRYADDERGGYHQIVLFGELEYDTNEED